jgi:hypothetical protein
MKRVLFALILAAPLIQASADPNTGRLLDNPVLVRAAARSQKAGTTRMARVARVASQSIMAGQVVSRMTDGTTVVAPLKRAHTARVPAAIDRLRSERALERIAAAAAADSKPGKRAAALETLATQIEAERAPKPPKGKGKAVAVAGVAVVGGAAAYFMSCVNRGLV